MTSPLQQKIKIAGPHVVTANRTGDGVVIYRTANRGWSDDLANAVVVNDATTARALLEEAVADDVGAIGAYLAPVTLSDGGAIEPGNLREHIRRDGITFDMPAA